MVRSRKGPAMNDYIITTDNNADLPEDFYKNHEVGCTYLSYTLEGKEYTEGNFLPVEEFYNKMRAGSMPTTSQVNPESARALFEPYLKDGRDILHIAFSSGLSGTFNSCRIAAEELMQEYPGLRIHVYEIINEFFGEMITVSGLLTGQDIVKQLKDKNLGEALYLPRNVLRSGADLFLDDYTLADVEGALQVPVNIVKSSGYDLVDALLGIAGSGQN